MIQLKDTKRADDIFGDWSEAMVWSCLQDVMGEIYADDEICPKSAMAHLGDFCFLAGAPSGEFLASMPSDIQQNFNIMVPRNAAWEQVIETVFDAGAKKIQRYAIRKETGVFNLAQLKAAVRELSPEYELVMIDENIYHYCRENDWSRDLVSQYEDYAAYKELGLGAAVLKDRQLVSGASSYARYRDGIEIEIDTRMDFRRKGLAYACGAKLIMECIKRGMYPSWDAQNLGSVALAEKLGYRFDHVYTAYEING